MRQIVGVRTTLATVLQVVCGRSLYGRLFTSRVGYGILRRMEATQKITAHVPSELLKRAQAASGRGVTETVRQGLELVAASNAAANLRKLRGKVRLSISLDELRRDRT
jgi:hypothetical protein